MPGHAWACRDMSRQRALQTSPGDRPATKPTNQEPTRSPRRPIRNRHRALGQQSPLSPHFLPYMGGPARTIKPFPTLTDFADSVYPADSLCFADPPRFLAYPPPGVLPESDRPIKGPDQRSIGVAPSSRGVSYNNIQLKTSRGVLFLPASDAYLRSFLYLLYTLIKLCYTKALSDQASSLAPD